VSPGSMSTVVIENGSLRDDGKVLALSLEVRNPERGQIFVCTSIGALRYDTGSRSLEIDLSPRGMPLSAPASRQILPRIVAVGPGRKARIAATIPRVLATTAPGSGQVFARVDRQPAHEATSVAVSVAWSDHPFTTHSGDPAAWAKGVATLRFTREPTGEIGS
jgi:hypothetical protein